VLNDRAHEGGPSHSEKGIEGGNERVYNMSCVTWQATWPERRRRQRVGVRNEVGGERGVSEAWEAAWGYEDGGGSREKERGCGFTRDAAGNADVRDASGGAILYDEGPRCGVGHKERGGRRRPEGGKARCGGNTSRSCVTWRSKHERGGRKLRRDVENDGGGSRTRWKGL